MKKIVLILLVSIVCINLNAQTNPFKKVGNDLPYPAIDAVFDKNNNLISICASADSLFIYNFNSVNSTWIKDSKIAFKNSIYDKFANQFAKVFYLDTTLYINISNGTDSSKIYRRNLNKTYTKVGILYKANAAPYDQILVNKIEKYNNSIILTGNFNYVTGGLLAEGIVKFNGTSFTNLNIEWEPNPNIFTTNDTLFYERLDTIFAYKLSTNTKSQYYVTNQSITALTGSVGSLYYSDNTGNVYHIKKNTLIEKTKSYNFISGATANGNLFFLNNQFIFNFGYTYGRREIYIKNGTVFKGLQTPNYSLDYNNTNVDDIKIIADQNANLYLISSAEREFNGVNYNIVKFKFDSLQSFGFDSIYLKTFGDKDNNGKFNSGDEVHSVIGYYMINEQNILREFSGSNFEKTILPNYRNYKLSAIWDAFDPSCYEMPISGSYTTNNLIPGKTLDTLEFAMKLKANISDKQIKFATSSRARLNDTIKNIIRVQDFGCNQGNTTAYAKVILKPKTVFISAGLNYLKKIGDTLFFKIDNINSTTVITFLFYTKYSNTDFKIDDIAMHHVILTQLATSNKTIYSQDSIGVKMVYSYDPNIKEAQPNGSVYTNANKFKYTIHFQNEGNDDARDVTVVDNLDSRFITSTIKMIESSHPYTYSVFKNTVTWQFKNINLKPKKVSEPLSSGYLIFEIEKNKVLNIGDSIRNKAEIYFDLNNPIITNYTTLRVIEKTKDTATTNIYNTLLSNHGITIYPNPSNGNFTLHIAQLPPNSKFEIINSLGQIIDNKPISNTYNQIAIINKGLYFIKIILNDKVITYKVMVE